jgi:hypothetical protein
MFTSGVANPNQLAVLSAALDDYCLEAGIAPSDVAREEVARHILDLFNRGVDDRDELLSALRSSVRVFARRSA